MAAIGAKPSKSSISLTCCFVSYKVLASLTKDLT
jgi:hypothetical protein